MAQPILRCEHCSCTLSADDFLNQPALRMDAALRHHHTKACVSLPIPTIKCWPDEQPPLVACALAGHTAVGLILLSGGADPDADGRYGSRALHAAAAADNTELIAALLAAGACATAVTSDDAHANLPGGRTPLHAAAENGASAAARLLFAAAPVCARLCDADGHTPMEVAWLAGHQTMAMELGATAESATSQCASDPGAPLADAAELSLVLTQVRAGAVSAADQKYAMMVRKMGLRERRRDALCIRLRPALRAVHMLRGAWSADECAALLADARRAASLHGWSHARHRHYPTTDLALWRAPVAASWVRSALTRDVLPAMCRAFGVADHARLVLREAFVACYDAREGGQPGLAMHRDGTLLSCSCLLNPRSDFDGGGTCFAQAVRVHEWTGGAWRRPEWRPCRGDDESGGDGCDEGGDGDGEGGEGEGGDGEGGKGGCGEDGVSSAESSYQYIIDGQQGDIVMHSGQQLHGGHALTSGIRYLLVVFVDEVQTGEVDDIVDTAAEANQPQTAATAATVAAPAAAPAQTTSETTSVDASSRLRNVVRQLSEGGVCGGEGEVRRRSIVGFHLDPNGKVPERKGRFTLPGGKSAFKGPVWRCDDEEPEEPPPPVWTVSLGVDGAALLEAEEIAFSPAGIATLRLTAGAQLDMITSSIECTVRVSDAGDAPPAAQVHLAPPVDLEEWVPMPGAKRPTSSLGWDVAGFGTICFDVATEDGGGTRAELRAVRFMKCG